jgi:magnesium transporter
MIRSFYYVPGEKAEMIEGVADFDKLIQRKDALLWVDMCKPDDQEQFILTHDFKFHPLAIEDVIAEKSRTKVDDYERYVFTVFQIVDYIGRDEGLKVAEMNLFLGENYIVTVHWDDHRIFDYLYHRAERDERLLSRGADFLLHTIIDTIVDNYNATLDILEYEVDQVEEDILGTPHSDTVKMIFTLRRDFVQLKRIVLPQMEVVNRFSREQFHLIGGKAARYFSDIYDHLVRINDIADSQRDILSSSLEVYYSAVSTKTNEIIRVLTIFTVLSIPPIFLVGMWGMNFKHMPELEWEYGYPLAVVLILSVVLGMVLFFRRKKWL